MVDTHETTVVGRMSWLHGDVMARRRWPGHRDESGPAAVTRDNGLQPDSDGSDAAGWAEPGPRRPRPGTALAPAGGRLGMAPARRRGSDLPVLPAGQCAAAGGAALHRRAAAHGAAAAADPPPAPGRPACARGDLVHAAGGGRGARRGDRAGRHPDIGRLPVARPRTREHLRRPAAVAGRAAFPLPAVQPAAALQPGTGLSQAPPVGGGRHGAERRQDLPGDPGRAGAHAVRYVLPAQGR